MIAVDTNVLVYAHREDLPEHRRALERLRELAEGEALWALPVFCRGEFVRIVTHPKLFRPPCTLAEAAAVGNLAFDAQIMALCREHGVPALLSEDHDFHRFRDFPVEHLR